MGVGWGGRGEVGEGVTVDWGASCYSTETVAGCQGTRHQVYRFVAADRSSVLGGIGTVLWSVTSSVTPHEGSGHEGSGR